MQKHVRDNHPRVGQVVPTVRGNGKEMKEVVIGKTIFYGHQYQPHKGHDNKYGNVDQNDPRQRIAVAELLLDVFPDGGEHGLNDGF
jgi:hypothetical protein